MKRPIAIAAALCIASSIAFAEDKSEHPPQLDTSVSDKVKSTATSAGTKAISQTAVSTGTRAKVYDQISKDQQSANRARELDRLQSVGDKAATLPDRDNGGAVDGALGKHGSIQPGDQNNTRELVRDVLGLGGNGLESAKIGRTDGGAADPARYGSGSAADKKGAPADPNLASGDGEFRQTSYAESRHPHSTAYTATFSHANGDVSTVTESWSSNKAGGMTHTVRVSVATWQGDSRYQLQSTVTTNNKGEIVDSNVAEGGRAPEGDDAEDLKEAMSEIAENLGVPPSASTPNDTTVGNGDPCNPVSGFGCNKRTSSYLDKVKQPVHGDEVTNLRGTGGHPNAGPSSITNPGINDGSSGGGNGGNGSKPGSGAIDPEEIIPPVGGGHD